MKGKKPKEFWLSKKYNPIGKDSWVINERKPKGFFFYDNMHFRVIEFSAYQNLQQENKELKNALKVKSNIIEAQDIKIKLNEIDIADKALKESKEKFGK